MSDIRRYAKNSRCLLRMFARQIPKLFGNSWDCSVGTESMIGQNSDISWILRQHIEITDLMLQNQDRYWLVWFKRWLNSGFDSEKAEIFAREDWLLIWLSLSLNEQKSESYRLKLTRRDGLKSNLISWESDKWPRNRFRAYIHFLSFKGENIFSKSTQISRCG
jgi:hypothetical protein